MQLVAYGAQDIYLTGNPQITFFKVVYRRHTNFSMECIKQSFKGTPGDNSRVVATLARNGDLVHDCFLKSVINVLGEDRHIINPGHIIINSIECEIGGQLVDKHYGHWLEVHSQLTEEVHPGHHLAESTTTLDMQIGRGDTESNLNNYQKMAYAGGISFNIGDKNNATASGQIMYVPLRFWFNRHVGLSLPLIALQYHEVNINIVFSDIYESVVSKTELWCNYIYLDTDERRRFAQVSHEYLIEQLQYNQFSVTNGDNSLKLNLNHPVKELIWGSRLTEHKVWGSAVTAGYFTSIYNSNTTVELKLNGHDRFEKQHIDYFTRYQPYKYHKGMVRGGDALGTEGAANSKPTVINVDCAGVYSFALKPEEHQPSGTCNFSRIDNCEMKINGITNALSVIDMYAVNYNVLRIMSGMGGLAYSN